MISMVAGGHFTDYRIILHGLKLELAKMCRLIVIHLTDVATTESVLSVKLCLALHRWLSSVGAEKFPCQLLLHHIYGSEHVVATAAAVAGDIKSFNCFICKRTTYSNRAVIVMYSNRSVVVNT